jgi:hypothetical protein
MILGEILHQLCKSATEDLWLVAPFIKVSTLERLLEGVSPNVRLYCVTRWRPEEIAVGVSDLDVWLLLKKRANSQLWLRHDLHAKYYRADDHCLMGSANITGAALGWSSQSNLELLLDVPLSHPALDGFELRLLGHCILVDNAIYEQTKAIVALLEPEAQKIIHSVDEPNLIQGLVVERESWIPSLRNPEQLYIAYLEKQDKLSSGVYETVLTDLLVLNIPPGLSKSIFEAYLGYVLLQMPIVEKVNAFVFQPRRFGEVSAYLKTLPCSKALDFDAKYAWQTLMRWLLYFLPQKYESFTIRYSEIFVQKDA